MALSAATFGTALSVPRYYDAPAFTLLAAVALLALLASAALCAWQALRLSKVSWARGWVSHEGPGRGGEGRGCMVPTEAPYTEVPKCI